MTQPAKIIGGLMLFIAVWLLFYEQTISGTLTGFLEVIAEIEILKIFFLIGLVMTMVLLGLIAPIVLIYKGAKTE